MNKINLIKNLTPVICSAIVEAVSIFIKTFIVEKIAKIKEKFEKKDKESENLEKKPKKDIKTIILKTTSFIFFLVAAIKIGAFLGFLIGQAIFNIQNKK